MHLLGWMSQFELGMQEVVVGDIVALVVDLEFDYQCCFACGLSLSY